jgi:hypothetical protein
MTNYQTITVGMRFYHDGQIFTCLSVNEGSSTVQCLDRREVTITNHDGSTRTFTARRGRITHLAARALVVEVPHD